MRHLFVLGVVCAFFQYGQAQWHQPVLTNLTGQALLNGLVSDYKPAAVLDFARSRDTLFSSVDGRNDSLYCVYTGYGIYLNPNQDPTQGAFALGINTEHTWPQAFGAESGNAQADMHHLFPTREDVNAARANLPFGELPDNQTQRWYRLAAFQTNTPSNALISQYSEWRNNTPFEPREDHKGNVARAMFYFYTMYRNEVDAADPNFFAPQRATLCQWHEGDPVDEREWTRTWRIAGYQDGKPNPFVLDCSLATRTYCPELAGGSCITSAEDLIPRLLSVKLSPNPTTQQVQLELSGYDPNTPLSIHWMDAAGRRYGTTIELPAGQTSLSLNTPGPGFWWCVLSEAGRWQKRLPLVVIP